MKPWHKKLKYPQFSPYLSSPNPLQIVFTWLFKWNNPTCKVFHLISDVYKTEQRKPSTKSLLITKHTAAIWREPPNHRTPSIKLVRVPSCCFAMINLFLFSLLVAVAVVVVQAPYYCYSNTLKSHFPVSSTCNRGQKCLDLYHHIWKCLKPSPR